MSETDNPYAAPESNPESAHNLQPTARLASRLSRLGASLLDSLIMIACIVPLMFAFGYFESIEMGIEKPIMEDLAYTLAGIVIFFLLNFKFLSQDGQTIGKKVAKIKIVSLDGEKANSSSLFLRYGFYFGLGQIPVAGSILSLVNILFIFGKDKRCIHDLVAGTKVVEAQSLVS